ncbi:hypothetical protein JP0113_13360 [Helicobacter pylori]|nr:hypothetical protein JP0113_13360 [Helicobacter pylori]
MIELLNYDSFRVKVLFSYLKQSIQNVKSLVELYREKKSEIEKIIEQANKDQKECNYSVSSKLLNFLMLTF